MDDFPNFNNPTPSNPDGNAITENSTADFASQDQGTPNEQPPAEPSYYPGNQAPQYTQPVQPPVQPYTQPMQQPYQSQAAPQYPPQNYPQATNSAPAYNYYQQQQPGYMPPVYPPAVTPNKSGDGFGIASLIIGIGSFVLFWIPILNVIIAVVGLIFGIIARRKSKSGLSLAGIIVSAIALGVGLIYSIAIIALIAGSGSLVNEYFNEYEEEWFAKISVFVNHVFHR